MKGIDTALELVGSIREILAQIAGFLQALYNDILSLTDQQEAFQRLPDNLKQLAQREVEALDEWLKEMMDRLGDSWEQQLSALALEWEQVEEKLEDLREEEAQEPLPRLTINISPKKSTPHFL